MYLQAHIKGLSTIIIMLLVIIAMIIGGIISYAFTIVYYTKIPEKNIVITNVYVDKENVQYFKISVLNPSYSTTDISISRIAISVKGETQLYDVAETEPSIENGLTVPIGESLNITCSSIKKNGSIIPFGEFAGTFAGEKVIIHVFSEDCPAANMEAALPFVKIGIAADFNPEISFRKFNVTLTNDIQSEVNVTINDIQVSNVEVEEINPNVKQQPIVILNGDSVCFRIRGSWYGLARSTLSIHTKQGYIFRREIETAKAHAAIQKVVFNENRTDHFNVTISNFAESETCVNVTRIECILEDGAALAPLDCGSIGIVPNSTVSLSFTWDWKKYRGKPVTVVAYFIQDFETPAFTAVTPHPIIVKVLNVESAFDLRDKGSFNITILNHASSLENISITKMVIKETGETLSGVHVNPSIPHGSIAPGNCETFRCTFDWKSFLKNHGRNLTLTLHVTADVSLEEYTFHFKFTLPVAKLNITEVNCFETGGTRYLNFTVKNMGYSLWNLAMSKTVIIVQDLPYPLEYVFPQNQIVAEVDCEVVLLLPFDWQKHSGKNITVTVFTEELVEVQRSYRIP